MKFKQGFFLALVLGFGLFFVAMAYDSKRVLSAVDAVLSKVSPSPTPAPVEAKPIKLQAKGKADQTVPAQGRPAPISGEAVYDQQYNVK